jgi:hypothetical protein
MFTLTTSVTDTTLHLPLPLPPPTFHTSTLSFLSRIRTSDFFLLQEKQVKEEEERKTRIQLYVFILR